MAFKITSRDTPFPPIYGGPVAKHLYKFIVCLYVIEYKLELMPPRGGNFSWSNGYSYLMLPQQTKAVCFHAAISLWHKHGYSRKFTSQSVANATQVGMGYWSATLGSSLLSQFSLQGCNENPSGIQSDRLGRREKQQPSQCTAKWEV
jgi:hypothetical protein